LPVSAVDLAPLLSLSTHRTRELLRELGIERKGSRFTLGPAVRAYVAKLRAKAETPTLIAARRRRMEAQAGRAEHDLKGKTRDLVSAHEVLGRMAPAIAAARQRILASSIPEEESHDILLDLQRIFENAGKPSVRTNEAEAPKADAA